MNTLSKFLLCIATASVFAKAGEISIGGHANKGTGANIGYTYITNSKWLWSIGMDYGLMNLRVMDSEYKMDTTQTDAIVALMEFKFEIGKIYDLTPTLAWKWTGGAGGALLDGTIDGMPGKDRSMWSIPVEVHIVKYTDETRDFGFFAGFNMTTRIAMNGELYDEINVITPQLRSGIVF